ncbi:MAG TPA: hypothetical protein VMM36_07815 [Opitutaceae bacterium]|nr:hypothetical protein [Opitutaceae bacterium]
MDTTGKVYIAITVIVLIGMIVAFWFISRSAPRGTLLIVGIILWVVGQQVSGIADREMRFLGGVCALAGFMGVLLGLFDVFRKKKPARDSVATSRHDSNEPPLIPPGL